MELGWERLKRQKYINEQLLSKKDITREEFIRTETIKFKGELITLPVIRVPLGLPKYSLANGRTSSSQITYRVKENLPNNFFADNEFNDAQRAQHKFLKKLAKKGINLINYFKEKKQEHPLILTPLGIVINGSRRLCTWRELFDDGYLTFEYIDVIVLPSSDERDLKKLEFELQWEKDIKVDYDWCSEALELRSDFESMSSDELSRFYVMKPAEIIQKIESLNLAELYLETIKEKLNYEKVIEHEFAFKSITEMRGKFKSNEPYKKDIFTTLSFIALQYQGDSTAGRMFAFIKSIYKNLDSLIEELENLYELSSIDKNIQPLEGELGSLYGEVNRLDSIANGLTQFEKKDAIAQTLEDVIDTQKEYNKEKDKSQASISLLIKGRKFINRSYEVLNDNSNIQDISKELDEIESTLKKIRKVAANSAQNIIS